MHRTTMTFCIATCLLVAGTSARAQLSSWEPMNRGLLHLLVYSIEIDPVDSLVMYCGTDYGNLYKSTDGGFNWLLSRDGIPSNYNQEYVSALHLDRESRRELYCGFGGRQSTQNLFHSTDAGSSWSVVNTPDSWSHGGVLHIYRSSGIGARLVCGLGWYNGIYCTSDGGATWQHSLTSYGIQCVTGHPGHPDVLFAGASSPGYPLRSTDGGGTWIPCREGIGTVSALDGVRAIVVDDRDPNLVFAGVTGLGAGLRMSTDEGNTWSRLNSVQEISEIAVHPRNSKLIYISAIRTGVWRTTDGGATWACLNAGLPTTDVMRVRIAPGYPVRVFAVTLKHGIYRLVDEELPEHLIR